MSVFVKVKVSVLEVGLWFGLMFFMFNFAPMLILIDPLFEKVVKSFVPLTKLISLTGTLIGVCFYIARCTFVLNPLKGHFLSKVTGKA